MEDKNYLAWLSIEDGRPVQFAELAHMMAKALHPSDDEFMDYGVARVNLEQELPQAVQCGDLVVRNPAGFGRHTFPVGQALKDSVILPQDLIPFLGARGIGLRIAKQKAVSGTIDWEYWRAMRKSKEWQACALSLGLDPDSMKGHPQAWMAGPDSGPLFTSDSFPSSDAKDKFEKRLRILRANRYDRAIFTLPAAQYSGLGPGEVLLSEFATWGASLGWNDMPPELQAIAKPLSPPPPSRPHSGPLPVVSADEWDTLVEQEDEARKDPAYTAAYDRAARLYDERDALLEFSRQDPPCRDASTQKRLSELYEEIAKSEARLGEPHRPNATEPTKQPAPQNNEVVPDAESSMDEKLAALFDPVTVQALEKMFPAEGQWKTWAERAARNGLSSARSGRGLFNPYRAAFWFLKKGIAGWDTARLNRTLANNLPARSRHDGHLLTGDIG